MASIKHSCHIKPAKYTYLVRITKILSLIAEECWICCYIREKLQIYISYIDHMYPIRADGGMSSAFSESYYLSNRHKNLIVCTWSRYQRSIIIIAHYKHNKISLLLYLSPPVCPPLSLSLAHSQFVPLSSPPHSALSPSIFLALLFSLLLSFSPGESSLSLLLPLLFLASLSASIAPSDRCSSQNRWVAVYCVYRNSN